MIPTLPIRRLVVFISIITLSFNSFSQSISSADGRFEIGLGLGPSFFLGDLGGTPGKGKTFIKDLNTPFAKMSKGLFVNFMPVEWLGFRAAFNQSILEADDAIISDKGGDEIFRKNRNLYFKSDIKELYVAAEIYPTVFFEQYDGLTGKLRPYGVIGAGLFHFNPEGRYIDPSGKTSYVKLQPLKLEGQGMAEYADRKDYKLTQLEIPMGIGFKYYLKESLYIGLEVLHRKTFTDYIDDVSTNYIDPFYFDHYLTPEKAQMARQLNYRENFGNPALTRPSFNEQRCDPTENDSFFSTIFRMGIRLNSTANVKQLRCPSFY
jgi:hypothetical protein